jgi:sterol desaturase/sphingolipid hydroxylase (fatty acid hydroxylase superfamily)
MEPSAYLPLFTIAVLAGLFAVERYFPLRDAKSAPSALHTLDWTTQNSFGLIALVRAPDWARFILAFLLLDLSFYYWHVLNHRVPVLWRFHNVHHIDPDLDVSTALRFHFGEVLFSTVFRITQVGLIGMSFVTFAVYESVFQANTLFHHSNVRMPIRLERLLNKVFVTPRMHGIHHSQVRNETNSNFGVVFSWWDRLHRSIGLNIPQSIIEIGIAGYSVPEDNRTWYALTLPFRKQRDYWRKPDGTVPERDVRSLQESGLHLAE